VLHNFEWILIPGLFQTRAYMYSLFQLLGERNPESLEKAVKLRIKRQKILKNSSKQFNIILSENSLLTKICAESDKIDQLESLKHFFSYENINIRILPFSAPMETACLNSFTIYDNKLVHVETMTSGLNIWHEEEVALYQRQYQLLESVSITGKDSLDLIDRLIKTIRG